MRSRHALHRHLAVSALLFAIPLRAAFAAEPPHAPVTPNGLIAIPAPPSVPRGLELADQFAGRRLFYDTRFAYLRTPTLAFDANWVSVSGSPGDILPPNHSGSEKLSVEATERRLSLVSQSEPRNGGRTILRTISDGTGLICTRFELTPPNSTSRTYMRLQLDDMANLQRSLQQVQVRPDTRGGEFALAQTGDILPASAILWKSGEQNVGGVRAVGVDEFDNRAETTGDANNHGPERYCRYLIDPDSHRLLRFETWDVDSSHPRPERQYKPKDANGNIVGQTIDVSASESTVIYRRESYEHVTRSSNRLASTLWALTVPETYKEQPLPTVNLPEMQPTPGPDAFDPRALGLIRTWREASQRFLTLSTAVEVLDHYEPRTDASRTTMARFPESNVHYDVVIQRPGHAHVTMHALSAIPSGRRRMGAREGLAVVDGKQAVAIVDDFRLTRPFRDPGPLYSYILQAGLRDPFNALYYLFNPAPDVQYYDRISYVGSQLLDGQAVEVITLHRTLDAIRQLSKSEVTIRCLLGQDGMPRQIETRTQSNINGRLERDQPPTNTRIVRYKNLLLDTTPAVSFDLP